jgi:transcriptional regulator with XRE-family HTH domain
VALGTAIRILRSSAGFSQSQLAKAAGISGAFLSLVESGEKRPSSYVLRKIAAGIGVPFEVLLRLARPDGDSAPQNEKSMRLFESVQKMQEMEDELKRHLTDGESDETERLDIG